ncbi:methyltransferase domain-containing protein [Streptosporangium jomthongense]|uniref:Protein-L-isoaspartate O-methyltransferase n=1 Tax=Streptosporangium jomthongense TaxID=1193683 RepID=A0ABV8FBL9_9ACTN
MTTSHQDRRALRDMLRKSGVLTPDWGAAFEVVPRHLFLPEVMWPSTEEGHTAVSRIHDPDGWWHWANADVPIVTQWDDGTHLGLRHGVLATSSSSMPTAVFSMFAELLVFEGAKVLEIGTGTGWCAALLSARLGERNVVSVEIDEEVADTARRSLAAAGWHPEIVVGDGLLGSPEHAPYDRVLVTAGVREVPHAWIEQTRPGGVLVMPWGTHYTGQNPLVRLVVNDDGSAGGRFSSAARFMHLRSQRDRRVTRADYVPGDEWPGDTRRSFTDLPVDEVMDDSGYAVFDFVAGLLVPGCVHAHGRTRSGNRTMWLYGLDGPSWAAVFFDEEYSLESRVFQGGPRDLWDEVEAAHRWWTEQGRPRHEEFGLTVTADGRQEVWFREPAVLLPRSEAAPAEAGG